MVPRTRRQFLHRSVAGMAALATWSPSIPSPHRRGARDLEALARRFIDLPREDGLRLIVRLAGEGWTRDQLLGAIYVAGAREVKPALGGISHCMMMVPSAFVLADAAPRDEALVAVLFKRHVDVFTGDGHCCNSRSRSSVSRSGIYSTSLVCNLTAHGARFMVV